jgi:pyruvate/2-oxoacid:ferredoxin oxidoreductase alpha subunit
VAGRKTRTRKKPAGRRAARGRKSGRDLRRAGPGEVKVITGNYAVAHAARLARVQVISAYPITPQTSIVEKLSELCGSGQLEAEFIKVESEHSAMSCLIGASLAGVRTFTATSSHGLAYMHEVLHWAAGQRLPIVLVNVNRAMGPGWNIWSDQTDSLAQRETGWAQFYCESNQEALDTVIQAFRVAEQALVPVMVVYDAFSLSHTSEAVELPAQEGVDRFLPPYRPEVRLDPGDPRFFGGLVTPEHYMEHRWLLERDTRRVLKLAATAGREYGRITGRSYPVVEKYRTAGAELLLLATGTIASTAKDVIDAWREQGRKVGLVRPRLFRPYPQEELRKVLKGAGRVAIVDRDNSFGSGGVWCAETRSALYDLPEKQRPQLLSYIAGLGGRDVTTEVVDAILELAWAGKAQPRGTWVGLKP